MSSNITICPFDERYSDGVINVILPIQVQEFSIPISIDQQPDLQQIRSFYIKGNGNFWVAMNKEVVVGTIALIDIGNDQVALRKMFVLEEYRGRAYNVAQQLLEEVFNWCKQKGVTDIYLGTIDVFKAAQRFYERNGFVEVPAEELPGTFPIMKVDNRFYHYKITS